MNAYLGSVEMARIENALAAYLPRSIDEPSARHAAVAVVLRPLEVSSENATDTSSTPSRKHARTLAAAATPLDVEVLLIRRATDPRDPWSGHMALPGGRRDLNDATLLATAMRETREEVGLNLEGALHLGRIDDVRAVARGRRLDLIIRPHVFRWTAGPYPLRLNYEVAEAIWCPLGPMRRGEVDTIHPWQEGGASYAMPAYAVDGKLVWGLTYGMLRNLFVIVDG